MFISANTIFFATGDTYNKLLLHLNGANTSTAFPDASFYAKPASVFGSAQISTSQSKFNGASALFNGSTDYITYPDSSDFDLATSDFTIDFWVRPASTAASSGIVSQTDTTDSGPFTVFMSSTGPTYQFYASSDGTAWNIASAVSLGTATASTWTHLAISRSGSTWYCFNNGTQTATFSSSASIFNSTHPFTIGRWKTFYFNGNIDEFRFSKGIARWTASFTPPTAPY